MTAVVTYLAKTHNRAVVKVAATAAADSVTIKSADLLVLGQSGWSGFSGVSGYSGYSAVQGPTSKMNIAGVQWSCDATGVITIVRNNVTLYKLFGSGVLNHATNENTANDIVVTFTGTAGGTVILELGKVEGWSAINPAGSM